MGRLCEAREILAITGVRRDLSFPPGKLATGRACCEKQIPNLARGGEASRRDSPARAVGRSGADVGRRCVASRHLGDRILRRGGLACAAAFDLGALAGAAAHVARDARHRSRTRRRLEISCLASTPRGGFTQDSSRRGVAPLPRSAHIGPIAVGGRAVAAVRQSVPRGSPAHARPDVRVTQ